MEAALKNVRSNVIAPFAWTTHDRHIPVTDEASAQRVERMRTGMRADQWHNWRLPCAAMRRGKYTGQIFAVRGNEVVLFKPAASHRLCSGGEGGHQHIALPRTACAAT